MQFFNRFNRSHNLLTELPEYNDESYEFTFDTSSEIDGSKMRDTELNTDWYSPIYINKM